jgi:hypothetical protein
MDEPAAFQPVKGKWGAGGATNVRLAKVKVTSLQRALRLAWQNIAPAHLARSASSGSE